MTSARTIISVIAVLIIAVSACAHGSEPGGLRAPPGLLDKVGFEQRIGAQVPLDLAFNDAAGRPVQLRDLLGDRPTVLVPGYFGCTNICSVVRSGVAQAVARAGLKPGEQFNVVLVSIDPHETPATAATAKRNDATMHADASIGQWHYLTGTRAASEALMRAIGFSYYFDKRNGQYDHDAGIVLLSPQGRVTQYLFGVSFVPQTLRLAVIDASHGKLGSIVDHFLLLCCNYDPSTGHYSLIIHRVMQVLGIATVITLCLLVALLRRSERRGRKWREA